MFEFHICCTDTMLTVHMYGIRIYECYKGDNKCIQIQSSYIIHVLSLGCAQYAPARQCFITDGSAVQSKRTAYQVHVECFSILHYTLRTGIPHSAADVLQGEQTTSWYPGAHQNNIHNKATSFIIHKLNVIFISLSDTYNYDKLTCFRECASAACILYIGLAIVRLIIMLVWCCGLYLGIHMFVIAEFVRRWLYPIYFAAAVTLLPVLLLLCLNII